MTAVIAKDDEPHDGRHLLVWDSKCLPRTAGDDGGRQGKAGNGREWPKISENSGRRRRTVEDYRMSSGRSPGACATLSWPVSVSPSTDLVRERPSFEREAQEPLTCFPLRQTVSVVPNRISAIRGGYLRFIQLVSLPTF